MKITKSFLKQIIKEELNLLKEAMGENDLKDLMEKYRVNSVKFPEEGGIKFTFSFPEGIKVSTYGTVQYDYNPKNNVSNILINKSIRSLGDLLLNDEAGHMSNIISDDLSVIAQNLLEKSDQATGFYKDEKNDDITYLMTSIKTMLVNMHPNDFISVGPENEKNKAIKIVFKDAATKAKYNEGPLKNYELNR